MLGWNKLRYPNTFRRNSLPEKRIPEKRIYEIVGKFRVKLTRTSISHTHAGLYCALSPPPTPPPSLCPILRSTSVLSAFGRMLAGAPSSTASRSANCVSRAPHPASGASARFRSVHGRNTVHGKQWARSTYAISFEALRIAIYIYIFNIIRFGDSVQHTHACIVHTVWHLRTMLLTALLAKCTQTVQPARATVYNIYVYVRNLSM